MKQVFVQRFPDMHQLDQNKFIRHVMRELEKSGHIIAKNRVRLLPLVIEAMSKEEVVWTFDLSEVIASAESGVL